MTGNDDEMIDVGDARAVSDGRMTDEGIER